MARYTPTFLIHFFCVCFSLANGNEINQLYMSIQTDVSYRPTISNDMIGMFTFTNKIECPAVCLSIFGCQLILYNSMDGSCTIYNSTKGVLYPLNGYIVYVVTGPISTTSTTTETTTTTIETTTTTDTTTTASKTTATDKTTTASTTTGTDTTTTVSTTTETDTSTTTSATTTSTTTITTVSDCISGTFPSFDTDLTALWRFDNSVGDDKALHDGVMMGDASFNSKGYINEDLSLISGSSSYIEAPYVDLVSLSFTIELWIRIASFAAADMILVSQNDLTLRISSSGRVFIAGLPPLVGTQLLVNTWYHIALIYDINWPQQQIYINGNLYSTLSKALSSTANTTFYIGTLDGTSEFYNGEIDHLSITTRVKSTCEILRDASLVASYSFTLPKQDLDLDSGPYGITGLIAGSPDSVAGVVGDAIFYDSSSTYFQVSGLTALTTVNGEFSFTLFIRPSAIRDCSIIFLSGTNDISDIDQARPYVGIDASGDLLAELPPSVVVGTPANIPANQWSHIALTYSFLRNNVSLYYNGILQISVPGPSSYNPPVPSPPLYITLASPLGGPNGSVIIAQPFEGAIDDFNIWSRELNASEVYSAATVS